MRALVAVSMVVVLAAIASAQAPPPKCPPFPENNVLAPVMCGGYHDCEVRACACLGSTGDNVNQCVKRIPETTTCATAQTCLNGLLTCLGGLAAARLNTSDACYNFGVKMQTAQLAAATGSYLGSDLERSCRSGICSIVNNTRLATCNFGVNFSNVCVAPLPAVSTLTPTAQYAFRGVIRLSGSNWDVVLADPIKKAQLIAALIIDLAALLGIPSQFVEITSLSVGSLVINYAVLEGSPKTLDELLTLAASATSSTTWLTGTKSVYATVSTETLTVLSSSTEVVDGTTTAAPGVSSASSVAVFAAAAIAVAATLF